MSQRDESSDVTIILRSIKQCIQRLDKLEEWKEMTPDTALVRESASQFNQRIIDLEKWKRVCVGDKD